jgi:proline dehydrogenase
MPGETIEAALGACVSLNERGMSTVVTQLGEAITDRTSAERVTEHYVGALGRIREAGLPTELSVKPTHLGLDVSRDLCSAQLHTLLEAASGTGNFVWVDMESSRYVDATLELYRELRSHYHNVGICLQSYLYRTVEDLASLVPLGAAIRLVKGAYMEPPDTAFPRKSDVDENFVRIAKRLLGEEARACGVRVGFGTHDVAVITRIRDFAEGAGVPKDAYEVQMLYGIRRDAWPSVRRTWDSCCAVSWRADGAPALPADPHAEEELLDGVLTGVAVEAYLIDTIGDPEEQRSPWNSKVQSCFDALPRGNRCPSGLAAADRE